MVSMAAILAALYPVLCYAYKHYITKLLIIIFTPKKMLLLGMVTTVLERQRQVIYYELEASLDNMTSSRASTG